MLFDTVCTVFNKVSEDGGEVWQSCALSGVAWQEERSVRTHANALSFGYDGVRVFIPFSVNSERCYLNPQSFLQAPENGFTLREGDVLVYGGAGAGESYSSAAEIKNAFPKSMRITCIAENDFGSPGMRHWEVSENEYDRGI